jgi:predicted amidohydrolase
MKVRVAGAQLPVTADVASNVKAICRAVEWSRAQGADILLTPEGSLSGYTHVFDATEVDDGLMQVMEAVQRARLGLALGTCFVEPEDVVCYNQIRFYDKEGGYLGFHSKTLRCGSLEKPPQGELNHYGVRPLRTFAFEGTTIAGLICNDLWANPGCTPEADPHLSQQLAEMGTQILFHAVNGGRDGSEWSDVAWQYHESNLRMRARAGQLWIVTVDSCHPLELRCSAPSGVIAPDGAWACRVEPRGERYFVWDIEARA